MGRLRTSTGTAAACSPQEESRRRCPHPTESASAQVLGQLATPAGLTPDVSQQILETLEKNPEKVKAYKNGKKGLIGFFMGEVMRQSKGKAEPKTTNELLKKLLEN